MKTVITSLLVAFCFFGLKAQKNVFTDSFKKNKNKWALFSNVSKDSATLNIAKEQLVVDNKSKGAGVALIDIPNSKIDVLKDEEVTISIMASHLSGNNLSSYGLVIGEKLHDNKFNGYVFSIVDTGYFRIFFSNEGKQIIVKEFTKSAAIKMNNATNKLTVIKKRNQFHFLINNQWVHNFKIGDSKVKSIGVINSDKQKVAFDDLIIESFAKITDKKDQDKINDLSVILQESQNQFTNTFDLNNKGQNIVSWLPYINEGNTNATCINSGYLVNKYRDNSSYEQAEAEKRFLLYAKYIEKVLGQFEKVEKLNAIGKKTYWLSKNPKYAAGTYILLNTFNIDKTYFVEIEIAFDKTITKEKL